MDMVFFYVCLNLYYLIDCIGIIFIWYICIFINIEDDYMLFDFVIRVELIDYFFMF